MGECREENILEPKDELCYVSKERRFTPEQWDSEGMEIYGKLRESFDKGDGSIMEIDVIIDAQDTMIIKWRELVE